MNFSADKYCVIPGTPQVRIADTSGHIVIVGEEPRPIPEIFVLTAKGKGCITETELNALKERFSAPAKEEGKDEKKEEPEDEKKDDAKALNPDKERFDKIVLAVIEMMNNGEPANFEKGGKPKVGALAEKCGFDVSGPERDAAFETATK